MLKTIRVRYSAPCACCGARIARGALAVYDTAARTIAHSGGSAACVGAGGTPRKGDESAAVNDYAGDGLDSRYEDQCAEICGR